MGMPNPRPAVVFSQPRTGSTFLTHCLSNHPDIFCYRGEALHGGGIWLTQAKVAPVDLLRCLLHQPHYVVSMCEVTTHQMSLPSVWEYLVELQPKVIHLYRKNVVRQAVDMELARTHLQSRHSMVEVPRIQMRMASDVVLRIAQARVQTTMELCKRYRAFFADVLDLSYAEIVGGEGMAAEAIPKATTSRICKFLEVPRAVMGCRLKAINPQPLRVILVNWPEVKKAIAASEFAWCLEDEGR